MENSIPVDNMPVKDIDFSILKPMVFFIYSTKELSKKDKVRFFYALNGRNGNPGVLLKFDANHLGITSILVPTKSKKEFIAFLDRWKISYKAREMLVE